MTKRQVIPMGEKYAKNEAEAPYAHENRSQLDNWPLNNFLRVHRGSLRIVCLLYNL